MDVNNIKVEFRSKFGTFEVNSTVAPSEQSIWVSNFNIVTSMYKFTTCKIKIKAKVFDPYIDKLERRDEITFSVSEDNHLFHPIFIGEISAIERNWLEDKTDEIEIDAQTPFTRLQETFVNQNSLKGCLGVRQIMERIMDIGQIWGTVIFDEDVKDDVEIGYIHNFSAFSLLKQICFQRDLVFDIDERENKLRISNRITSEKEKHTNIQTISANDVLSMKIRK